MKYSKIIFGLLIIFFMSCNKTDEININRTAILGKYQGFTNRPMYNLIELKDCIAENDTSTGIRP
jgi:hypothetical protein